MGTTILLQVKLFFKKKFTKSLEEEIIFFFLGKGDNTLYDVSTFYIHKKKKTFNIKK